jgi:hypothetical protein
VKSSFVAGAAIIDENGGKASLLDNKLGFGGFDLLRDR